MKPAALCFTSLFSGADMGTQLVNFVADRGAESGKSAHNCDRDQGRSHCVFGQLQTCLIAKEFLNHFVAPFDLVSDRSVTRPQPGNEKFISRELLKYLGSHHSGSHLFAMLDSAGSNVRGRSRRLRLLRQTPTRLATTRFRRSARLHPPGLRPSSTKQEPERVMRLRLARTQVWWQTL